MSPGMTGWGRGGGARGGVGHPPHSPPPPRDHRLSWEEGRGLAQQGEGLLTLRDSLWLCASTAHDSTLNHLQAPRDPQEHDPRVKIQTWEAEVLL